MHNNLVKTLKDTAMSNLNMEEGKRNSWSPKDCLKETQFLSRGSPLQLVQRPQLHKLYI